MSADHSQTRMLLEISRHQRRAVYMRFRYKSDVKLGGISANAGIISFSENQHLITDPDAASLAGIECTE